jgi:predicted phage terminase large subunit-like protein
MAMTGPVYNSRASAEAWYTEVLTKAREEGGDRGAMAAMATLGRVDLWYLLTRILFVDPHNSEGHFIRTLKAKQQGWLFERVKEVMNDPNGFLDLWAREHFKTTIITIAKSIQDIINDPEITIAIFSFNFAQAIKPYRVIKAQLEGNEVLRELYPEVLYKEPAKSSPKWTEQEGLIVKRKGTPRECTVQAFGLTDGQMPVGDHFKIRIYDDVITQKHVTNPEQIKKAVDQWELSLDLGSQQPTKVYNELDIARYVGTRYHFNDPYRTIMERRAATPRLYPATDDGTPTGKPVFLDQKVLDEKRRIRGPYQFSCQQLLNPVADEAQGFKEEWLQYCSEQDWRVMNLYLLCDPAGEKKSENDYTVILIIGLGMDQNYYLIDGIRDRLNLTERARKYIEFHRKYHPRSCGYEKYGKDSDIEHIKYVQNQENYRFWIEPLGGRTKKNDRIRKLIPLFEEHRFWLPPQLMFIDHEKKQRNLVGEFVNDEYKAFPVGVHDDILDCMARILDEDLGAVFPMPIQIEDFVEEEQEFGNFNYG